MPSIDPFVIVLVVLVAGMFWMNSRQRKTQREATSFIDSLEPGTRVQTLSGLVGSVVSVDDQYVTLESEPGQGRTTWVKAAIRKVPVAPKSTDADADAALDETSADDVVIPDNVAKLIGEDTSSIDKLTKSDQDRDDESGTKK